MLVFRAVFPPEKWGEPYNSWVTIPKTNSEFTPWKMMVWRLLSLWEEPLWRVVYKPLLQALKRIIPAIWKKNMGVYNPPAHMGKRADRKKNLWSLQIFDQKMPLDWGNHSLRHSQIYFYVGTLIYQTFWKLYRLAMSQEIRNHKWQWIYPPVGVLQLCMCIHISIYIYTQGTYTTVLNSEEHPPANVGMIESGQDSEWLPLVFVYYNFLRKSFQASVLWKPWKKEREPSTSNE